MVRSEAKLMNSYQKYTKDIVTIGITNTVIALRGLILLPIISKTLGASGYGVWAQIMVTLFLIDAIATLNLSASLARFLAAEKDKGEIREGFFSAIVTVFGWSLVIALILFLLGKPFAGALLHDRALYQIVYLTALVVPFWAVETVCLGLFRAFREMKTYSLLLMSRNLLELALIAYLVLSGYGIFGAVIAVLIARVVIDAIMLSIIIRRIGVKLPNFSKLRQYLTFGAPMIPGLLSAWVTSSSDRYVIGIFLGVTSVGIYSAGYSVGSIISFFIAPLTFVLLPTLSRLYDEDRIAEVKAHLTYSLKYFLMLAIPSTFGLSLLAKPLLHSLTTLEFVPTGSLVAPVVAVSYLLFGVYAVFSQVFILVKKTKIIGILWGGAALLNLTLNIIFVPRFGVVAAAVTTLVCYTIVAGMTVSVSAKHLRFSVEWTFILKSIVASLVMALIVWKLSPAGMVNILWVAAVGATIYFIILFLMKGFSFNEIRFFRQLIRRD